MNGFDIIMTKKWESALKILCLVYIQNQLHTIPINLNIVHIYIIFKINKEQVH